MKDTFFLVLNKSGIIDFKKTERGVNQLRKGEIPVKINLTIDDSHFKYPTIVKNITVEPWDKNLAIEDPHFESDFITEEEAKLIEEHRLEHMKSLLTEKGYTITKNDK